MSKYASKSQRLPKVWPRTDQLISDEMRNDLPIVEKIYIFTKEDNIIRDTDMSSHAKQPSNLCSFTHTLSESRIAHSTLRFVTRIGFRFAHSTLSSRLREKSYITKACKRYIGHDSTRDETTVRTTSLSTVVVT